MARYYDEEGYPEYKTPRRQRRDGPAWVMAAVMVCGQLLFGTFLLVDMFPAGGGRTDPAPAGAVGNQAPPAAVRRGNITTSSQPAGNAVQTSIDQYNAVEQAKADALTVADPLPLNSAGEPVISQEQADQQALSLNLALDEGMAAADAQLAAERQAMYTAVAVQAPDVSYDDAKALLGRDPCHVPRADPHTCDKGLYKPTPVN